MKAEIASSRVAGADRPRRILLALKTANAFDASIEKAGTKSRGYHLQREDLRNGLNN
jgi:hypothetical protein